MATVAELLAQSRAAHQRYRDNAGRINLQGEQIQAKRHDACRDALQEAHDTRIAAHDLDPQHDDPDWALDKAPHDELLKFYETQLARYAA